MKQVWVVHSFITGALVAVTLLALVAGRAFGGASPALYSAEECNLPCWNTISPGETGVGEAINVLRSMGYHARRLNEDAGIATNLLYINSDAETICQVGLTPGNNGRLRELILRACEPLPLGEVLNLIGSPDSMLPMASLMIFQEGQTILTLRAAMCENASLSPHASIRYLSLADSTLNSQVASQRFDLPWAGFVPFWHYGRLFPDKPVC